MISLIVAASENNVIGRDNQLPWRLSADLKRFKTLTTGHTIIMGRKTYESIGLALPNRRSIVISRRENNQFEGVETVDSLDSALQLSAEDNERFIIGGAQIYECAMDCVDRLYLTRVHVKVEGDTFFTEVDPRVWSLVSEESYKADGKNDYPFTFQVFERH
ncbi:dihydrofolate reductase [bacterium AH-315-E10]|nr:dihydrofolate reductase [bacterium AH-315-E10]